MRAVLVAKKVTSQAFLMVKELNVLNLLKNLQAGK